MPASPFLLHLTLAALTAVVPADDPSRELSPGGTVERALAGGEAHRYRIDAQPGEILRVSAEQLGVDLVLAAFGPDGREIAAVDGPTGRRGPESLLLRPAVAGPHGVEVRSPSPAAPPGRYRLTVEPLASGTPEVDRRIEAEALVGEAGRLFHQGTAEGRREAAALQERASELWRSFGIRSEEARSLYALAGILRSLGEGPRAVDAYRRALPLWAALGDEARRADTLTGLGLALWSLGENDEALEALGAALALHRAQGDLQGEAATLNNVCLVRHSRGEWRAALACYERALGLMREAGDSRGEAVALTNIGGVYDLLGEPQEALARYGEALDRMRALGDRGGEARTLNNLAVVHGALGGMDEALAAHDQALALFRAVGDRGWEARTLNNLGWLYRQLGELRRARLYFEQSLALRRELGDRRGEATTLTNLASLEKELGNLEEALDGHGLALAIARDVGDRRAEALALVLLGEARVAAGEAARGLEALARAVDLYRELGDRRGTAQALQTAATVQAGLGVSREALAGFTEALELQRAVEDRPGQTVTLASLAGLERRLGLLDEAAGHLQQALEIVESLRSEVASPDLRASFLAARRRAFELAIDVHMELERREPGRGHAEKALAVSERARARSLLELLQEARADLRRGVEPELRERERALRLRLRAKANRRIELLSGSPSQTQKDEAERDLQELLAELDAVESEIRRRSPRYAALTQPSPLGADGIRALLDPGTLLLQYALGEDRSFLWAVTPESVKAFELPPRSAIEEAARRVYEDLRTLSAGAAGAEELSRRRDLARLLLGPVAASLGERRLVLVTDGALQYLPFAALPEPGATTGAERLLIERHEILDLPSASVLAIQRREGANRTPAPRAVAVLADPVFDAGDPRVRIADAAEPPAMAAGREPERSATAAPPSLPRLPGSRREAEVIAGLLPADQVLVTLDFDARRATLLAADLTPYRIVHFATHGVIDDTTPELSGLVLSRVDGAGRPLEGFLSLGEIYNLELRAELVVLSGCETALGREIRGEGLVGLTQGFFHAGAERVAASLWRVQDRATAELMERFYRAMLRDGLSPAAALRSAQLSLLRERRWRDPYHWAPFVLQGDWR
jgi:CHAT domain-containing protein/Tfp pilus assembly protein PilF